MLAPVLAVVSLFAQAFGGMWTCHSNGADVPWVIAPAPGSAWTTVRWSNQSNADGGIAYVGYVEPNKQWVYEDFHYDGSYAVNTSEGPHDNQWSWSGTYYLGQRTMHGQVIWKLASPARIERTFIVVDNGKATPSGADYCTKTTP